jgi:hypothetical protein
MRRPALLVCLSVLVPLLAGCGAAARRTPVSTAPPSSGACRVLAATDLTHHADDHPVVPCARPHTAQTFLVGTLPASTGTSYDDRRHGAWVLRTCQPAFERFVGADESLAMRIRMSWSWFRPSTAAWDRGARWFRCDVVGGPGDATPLRDLPYPTKGLFGRERPDEWAECASGAQFAGSPKVSCDRPHQWRAIATVKLGEPDAPYPGDRISQVKARDYCSDQVGAWSNYSLDYDYAYTWFHEAEWRAGNRRAICWARTTK